MADWPETDDLKRVIDADPTLDVHDVDLGNLVQSAITRVQQDCALTDSDTPTANQAAAALRMAELLAQRPAAAAGVGNDDPTYNRLLYGHRRVFGIA